MASIFFHFVNNLRSTVALSSKSAKDDVISYFYDELELPLFGLTGALGVPYTRNRQYAGVTAAGGPVDAYKPI